MANELLIEKQTGGYFKFTLNNDSANAITSIQNDLLAVGTQLHFKTGNGANIIKEQFIYPEDVTIVAGGTFTFTTVAGVWDKLIDIDYFAWLGGGGDGVDRFDDLLDTFQYNGNAGKVAVVDNSEVRLIPITLYNKRLFTELEDTPSDLVPDKMVVVNPAGTALILQDQPEPPEQFLNSVGYFDYEDLTTQSIPLVAVANVAKKLTNDTEGVNTNTDQNPYGVSFVWDFINNQFNFSELSIGDTIDLRVHIRLTTTTNNQKVDISGKFGIGSASEFTNSIYSGQFKTSGQHEISFVAPFYMGSLDILNNPAELYLTTDSSATIRVYGWYVRILRKNINIITVDYEVPDATTLTKGIVRLAGDLGGNANNPTVPELANKVPNSRTISTTSPLLGGGNLGSDLTLSVQQANSVNSGFLSSSDWINFNDAHNDKIVSAAVTGTTTKTLSLNQHDGGTITATWDDDDTPITLGTPNGLSLIGRVLSLGLSSSSLNGALSSTDWNTFNSKQNALNGTGFVKVVGTTVSYDNSTYALDSAVVKLTGDQTITGKKTFDSSAGSSDAIEIISNSTGYGINLSHPSGGTAIFVSNPVGVGLNINNIGTNSFGISISNPSTGRAINIGNSGAGTGFYSSNTSTGRGIWSSNTGAYGIYSENAGAGDGIYSQNSSTGKAFSSWNSSTGIGIYSNNTSSGRGLVLNNTTASTGMPFTVSKNSVDKFTINDAGEATGVKFIKSGGTSSQFLKADGSVDSTTYQTALTNPVTGTGTTGNVAYWNGTSSITGESNLFWDSTNDRLGIGTNTPSQLLTLGGAANVRMTLLSTTTTGSSEIFFGDSDSVFRGFIGYQHDGDLFQFSTAASEKMRLTSNGELLIGRTSSYGAGWLLAVEGNMYAKNDLRVDGGGSFGGNVSVPAGSGLVWSGDASRIMTPEDNVSGALIQTPGIIRFNAGSTERMRITSGGSVGIGTPSPTDVLHLNRSGIGVYNAIHWTNPNSTADFYVGIGGSSVLNGSLQNNAYLYNAANSAIVIGTNDTERMRITSGGNVGIGTTTNAWGTDYKALQISTGISISSDEWNGYGEILNNAFASARNTFSRIQSLPSTRYSQQLGNHIWYSGSTGSGGSVVTFDERMRITSGGNVGIGTTTPKAKTEFASGLPTSIPTYTNRTNGIVITDGGAIYGRLGVSNFSSTGAGYPTYLQAGDFDGALYYNLLLNPLGGNVGIGTTSPAERLQVLGNIRLTSNNLTTANTVSSEINNFNGSSNQFKSSSIKFLTGSFVDQGHITFNTSIGGVDQERLRIAETGNVGIGTTSPIGKLTVKESTTSFEINTDSNQTQLLSYDRTAGVYKNINIRGNDFIFSPLDVEKVRITSGGNVGIGVVPKSWDSLYKVLQISDGALTGTVDSCSMSHNLWQDGETPTYITSRPASVYSQNSGNHYWDTAPSGTANNGMTLTPRMILTNSGNLGIGKTNVTAMLSVSKSTNSGSGSTFPRMEIENTLSTQGNGSSTFNFSDIRIAAGNDAVQMLLGASFAAGVWEPQGSINVVGAHPLIIKTTNTERMRITSGGALLVGTTSVGGSGGVTFGRDGAGTYFAINRSITSNTTQIEFNNPNGLIGSITTNGSTTSYNTSSDYRLKQDLKPINGLDLISQIKVYDYEWKVDQTRSYGVLAHELQEVIPQAVSGEKDDEKMQGVDYSKLVPILVQAIQEQQKQIEELKLLINK